MAQQSAKANYLCRSDNFRDYTLLIDKTVKDGQHRYMIHSTVSETKNHLSELLAGVRKGETLIIMDRKTPVARVEAVPFDRAHPFLSSPVKKWNPREILSLPIGVADSTLTPAASAAKKANS